MGTGDGANNVAMGGGGGVSDSTSLTDGHMDTEGIILASASYDHTIRLWDVKTGLCVKTLQHADSQVNALAMTPDRVLIAAAGYQHIRMYDIRSREPGPDVDYGGVTKNVTGLGFEATGRWMYTGGEDCTARIWDLRGRNVQCSRIFQVSHSVNTVCLHPNQCELIVGDQGGTVYLWDLRNDHNEQLMPVPGISIQHVDVDPDGTKLAAVSNKGQCFIWNIVNGAALASAAGMSPTAAPTPLPGSATNGSVASGGPQGPLPGDSSPSGLSKRIVPYKCFDAHKKYALKCRFSPDSTLLATTSGDTTVVIWRTTDLSKLRVLKTEKQRWVWDCAFTADSRYIVTASSDNALRLWNLEPEDAKIEREFSGHQKAVTALALNDVPVM